MPWTLAACLILLGGLSACRNDDIATYRLEKPADPAASRRAEPPATADAVPMDASAAPMGSPAESGASAAAAAAGGELSWKLPRGWTEKPPTDMRLGSFSAGEGAGGPADISVVALAGEAGGALANVNRWRDQLELPPIGASELPRCQKKIAPAGRTMRLVDLVSRDGFLDGKHRKRLIAVVYARGGRTWFFKMTGEDAQVRKLRPSLLRFLESLRFADEREGA